MKYRWIALCLVTGLFSCAKQQDTVTLRIGHTLDTQHSVHKAMEHMADQLALYSNNTMQIKLYPSAQLGSEREMVELLQIGSLAMTKVGYAKPKRGLYGEYHGCNSNAYFFR